MAAQWNGYLRHHVLKWEPKVMTQTCVQCGTEIRQQREGVIYECDHCLNQHYE